jgi:hypothetical protein
MSADPLTYIELKFPAPVCDDCASPMFTVTVIFNAGAPHTTEVVYYQCQKCRCTLGALRRRRAEHDQRHAPDGHQVVSR